MTTEQTLAETLGIPFTIAQVVIHGHKINYLTAGEGSPVVMLHGVNFGWGVWCLNIPELAKHFKVYAIDLPGAGRSSRINYNTLDPQRDFVDVVGGFIIQMGLEHVAVVGHSFGAWITLSLAAAKNPSIRAVIATNSLGLQRYIIWKYRLLAIHGVPAMLSRTVMKPTLAGMRKFLIDPMRYTSNVSNELVSYLVEGIAVSPATHPLLFMSRLITPFGVRGEFMLPEQLSRITVPTLIVLSDNDPLIPLQKIPTTLASASNVQVHVFPDTGHVPPIEKPREFNSLVINFLKTV